MKCTKVADFIEQQIQVLIEGVVKVVETVCHDIVETIEVWEKKWEEQCETVQKKVCKWLPWPLDKLCEWVTETVCKFVEVWFKVIKTITKTVCEVVTSFVKIFIIIPMTIVLVVFRIVCFIIDFIVSWIKIIFWIIAGTPEFLLCLLGIRPRKHIHVCVTILADAHGQQVVPDAQVDTVLNEARQIISRKFNVNVRVHGRKAVRVPESRLDVTACDASQLFSAEAFDLTVEGNRGKFADLLGCQGLVDLAAGPLGDVLNIIFIRDILEGDDIGCHIPGTDYVIVDRSASGLTLAHEIGHAGDLWHVSKADNLMNHITIGESVYKWQVCVFRRSRFVVYVP